MSYDPRRPMHAVITTGLMVGFGFVIAMYGGTWLLIVPVMVATLSAGSGAGLLVAILAHSLNIMRFEPSLSNISIMVIDIGIVVLLQTINYRMRMHYVYTSLYPVAIVCILVRSVLIVFGTWIQSLFAPQASLTQAPIDVLTMMLTGPALLMTVIAIVGVLVINMLLRQFLP
jgi:hypothetical protein